MNRTMNIIVGRAVIEQALEALENLPALSWVPEQERTVFEAITALRTALEQPEQEPVACRDEMCACRGGPCASCPDGEREKELADVLTSRDFYKRRTDELQKVQSQMRDPERTMVCDILANGRLLAPAGGRYSTSPPQRKPLSDEEIDQIANQTIICWSTYEFARAIEAAHGIKEET